ncbi:DUF2848 domain-containing protein [Sporolituus thermophilus]|uniref:DUF2848 domain-containing protein n=1 Tax=Sporolituus thermophilus DSM 23256 TaxID=1123285 RepID=A0A1G7JGH9_9FIRM|nr:DUF2848 domain-containing protein [Sporolituus thermophilus]SDF24052.1 Protein of unknown function [Sporolituus thermophilus DSM 23256]
MKNLLELTVVYKNGGCDKVGMVVENIYNGGYAGRNQEHVREHIEELAKVGVPAPTTTPTLYPLANYNLTTADRIQVQNSETSGEIEYVLLWQAGRAYVTVGSDHTDRELENFSVAKSKQACPNIIAKEVWLYEDVKDHWDQIQLKCWVTKDGQRVLYQDATLAALMRWEEWEPIFTKLGITKLNNSVFFSGTINTVGKALIFADKYELEMIDPVLGRSLRHEYTVQVLPDGIK